MKVVIIALYAGTAGVVHRNQVDPHGEASFLYDEARTLMAREIQAAVTGAQRAGASEVIVHDATGLVPFHEDLLHPGATYVFGEQQQVRFAELANANAAILLGHPAKAGAWGAVLCQTLAPSIQRVLINGQDLGTIGIHAALCGTQNVPVVLVSGDNHACAEAESLLPGVRTCTTKWGFGFQAAKLRPPATVRAELDEAVCATRLLLPLSPRSGRCNRRMKFRLLSRTRISGTRASTALPDRSVSTGAMPSSAAMNFPT